MKKNGPAVKKECPGQLFIMPKANQQHCLCFPVFQNFPFEPYFRTMRASLGINLNFALEHNLFLMSHM